MTERKFNIPLILLAAVSFALGFFGLPVGSILLALISVISITASSLFLGFLIWQECKGIGSTDYWLMRLIFGDMK